MGTIAAPTIGYALLLPFVVVFAAARRPPLRPTRTPPESHGARRTLSHTHEPAPPTHPHVSYSPGLPPTVHPRTAPLSLDMARFA